MMVMKLKGTFGNLLMDIYIYGNHVTSPEFINQEVWGTTGSIWSYELRNNNVLANGSFIIVRLADLMYFDLIPLQSHQVQPDLFHQAAYVSLYYTSIIIYLPVPETQFCFYLPWIS
jgi:hypothetical protein